MLSDNQNSTIWMGPFSVVLLGFPQVIHAFLSILLKEN